jgi:hypothetical protein
VGPYVPIPEFSWRWCFDGRKEGCGAKKEEKKDEKKGCGCGKK